MTGSKLAPRRTAIYLTRKQAMMVAKLTHEFAVPITLEQVSHARSTRTYANIGSGDRRGRYVITSAGRARRVRG